MTKIKITPPDVMSLVIILGMVALIFYSAPNLPAQVPIFYTLAWGGAELARFEFLFILPLIGLLFLLFNLAVRALAREVSYLTLIVSLICAWSLFRIISSVSPLWPHAYFDFKNIILPLLLAAGLSLIISRPLVTLARRLGIVDDPKTHHHPGMLLTKVTPRAGAVAFFISFLVAMFLIVPGDQIPWGIVIGAGLYTILGVVDDKFDLNPYVRFSVLGLGALVVAVSGIGIKSFGLPVGSVQLDQLAINLPLLGSTYVLADIFTIFWILWVSNLLSWSNGIDGQFAGVAGITALFISLLSLRLIPLDHNQIQTARIAAIAAGAAIGLVPVTWNPCKILWGFGATGLGLILASLSVISGSKVAVATLVIMIPFLDAIATIIRRLSLKKSPFWGDRGHLHHRLLDAGLTQPQIAILYWAATVLSGFVAVFMTGKIQILAIMTAVLATGSLLLLTNVRGSIKIPQLLKRALPSPRAKAT